MCCFEIAVNSLHCTHAIIPTSLAMVAFRVIKYLSVMPSLAAQLSEIYRHPLVPQIVHSSPQQSASLLQKIENYFSMHASRDVSKCKFKFRAKLPHATLVLSGDPSAEKSSQMQAYSY